MTDTAGAGNHPVQLMPAGELITPHRRIAAVLDHLGIQRAHFAAGIASDMLGLLIPPEERVASLTLINPNRLETAALSRLGKRLGVITGSDGLPSDVVRKGMPALPDARLVHFTAYYTTTWSDLVRERPHAVIDMLHDLADDFSATILSGEDINGEIEGIRFSATGSGPALILLPLLLAPSQWRFALDELARVFRVILLGGAHLGMVAMLESRGSEPGYLRVVGDLVDELQPASGDKILEIGCGTGVLSRWITHRTGGVNPFFAADLNPYFLGEARPLSGDLNSLNFIQADAEHMPFADGSIDIVFSATLLEECDADRTLLEMVRVTRPGGRLGAIVRATDMQNVCTVPVEPSILKRVQTPYQSVGEKGCADTGLYQRFAALGLEDLRFFPHQLTLRDPKGAAWAYREAYFLSQFNEDETRAWLAAKQTTIDDGSFLFSAGLHCAVGTKPGP